MSKKPKFNPEITRVKLNPEQAVLVCSCYTLGQKTDARGTGYTKVTGTGTCIGGSKLFQKLQPLARGPVGMATSTGGT